MRPVLFTISRDEPGTLSTMLRPRGGEWLEDEMTDLAAAGITIVVSMLTSAEAHGLGLAREGDAARAAGVEFRNLPVPDREVPDRAAVLLLARDLALRLRKGAAVAVHCLHGIGRSSTLAAAVLILEGVQPADAWAKITAARGLQVPDTTEQRQFINSLNPSSQLPPGWLVSDLPRRPR